MSCCKGAGGHLIEHQQLALDEVNHAARRAHGNVHTAPKVPDLLPNVGTWRITNPLSQHHCSTTEPGAMHATQTSELQPPHVVTAARCSTAASAASLTGQCM